MLNRRCCPRRHLGSARARPNQGMIGKKSGLHSPVWLIWRGWVYWGWWMGKRASTFSKVVPRKCGQIAEPTESAFFARAANLGIDPVNEQIESKAD